eukprot:403334645
MGSCSGKGSDISIKYLEDLKTQTTGVTSVDAFGEKVNQLLEKITLLVKTFLVNKRQILRLTGFAGKRHLTLEHALLGLLLQAGSKIPLHDFSKVNLRLIDECPFIEAEKLGDFKICENEAEVLKLYVDLIKVAKTSLAGEFQKHLETAQELEQTGKTIMTDAKNEFEALGTLEKFTATSKAMKVANASIRVRIAVEGIKQELEQSIKNAQSARDKILDKHTFLDLIKKVDKKKAKDCYSAYEIAYVVPKPVENIKIQPQPKK